MNEVRDILKTMEYGPAPEVANLAEAWLDGHGRKFGHFIDGQMTPFTPGKAKSFASTNPATGEKLADISIAGEQEVDHGAL